MAEDFIFNDLDPHAQGRPHMSTKHLQRQPYLIYRDCTAWWYEEGTGITIVVESATETKLIRISWTALRRALARKEAPHE